MIRRRPLLFVLAVLAACGDNSGGPADAAPADATAQIDGAMEPDGAPPLGWVDFAVDGCQVFDPAGPTCRVVAPATLRFTAIAPSEVDTTLWSFGDGSPVATGPFPEHTYPLPGIYDVTLTVGGPGGTAQVSRPAFVVVRAAPTGDPCDLDAQCAAGLECVCGDGAKCPAGLAQGMCTRDCGDCDPGEVCADLDPAGTGDPTGWQRPLCLRGCGGDADCAPGLACRELVEESGGSGGWVRGCFAPAAGGGLADDGASCLDGTGAQDHASCASGMCATLGARGMCQAACASNADCPSYAACSDLGCVARCTADRPCDDDPYLACEAPDATGSLGFTVAEPPAAGGYCAPRRCMTSDECGSDGACLDSGGALFCQPG